jgi:HEAT repeat protein
MSANLSESLATLVAQLEDPDEGQRQRAVEEILQLSEDLARVLLALPGTLKTAAGPLRARAAETLGDVGEQLLASIPAIRSALKGLVLTERDAAIRTAALMALVQIGPQTRSQVPALIDALADEVAFVRLNAAHTLREMGPAARAAIAALTTASLRDADFRVRFESAIALWKIDRRTHGVLTTLIQGLQHEEELLRWMAADTLGEMGDEAREAVPALLALWQSQKDAPLVRMSIGLALERIDPDAAARAGIHL